jgi:ATP-dependent RNA helicase DeaD
VRAYRARLPEPEDLFSPDFARNMPGPKPERGERPGRREREREPRPDSEPMLQFRINIGRQGNADPRWLIPLLCRRGHVTKKDIGTIRIMDRETKFGIAERVAARFAASVGRSNEQRDDTDADLKIEPMDGPGAFTPTTKRARGSESRGPDRPQPGHERPHPGDGRKPGFKDHPRGPKPSGPKAPGTKSKGGGNPIGEDRKNGGGKPFRPKEAYKDGDRKGGGRALAGKWDGKKKGGAPR